MLLDTINMQFGYQAYSAYTPDMWHRRSTLLPLKGCYEDRQEQKTIFLQKKTPMTWRF